ncbi:MAG: DUF4294 domain-containing protein [Rikenellaceae bacterium]
MRLGRLTYIILAIILVPCAGFAQQIDTVAAKQSQKLYPTTMLDGERVIKLYTPYVFVFADNKKSKALEKKYTRLINAIKVTYPIAQVAQTKLRKMEKDLETLTPKEQREYTKALEKELKEEYTPILKKMSMYQGIVLLKLIDRQTGDTSYELVKEFRGGLSAFFWQGIAKIFGANLKTEYNEDEDDVLLEKLVRLYERGLL